MTKPRRQTVCKPGSVQPLTAWDGHSSGTRLAARLTRPTRAAGRKCPCGTAFRPARRPPLFGLAPGGVCPAAPVTGGAVRSCRSVSPLPAGRGRLLARAVCFLWHFPWGRPRRPLAGTVFPWSPDFPPPRVAPGSGRPAVWRGSDARAAGRRQRPSQIRVVVDTKTERLGRAWAGAASVAFAKGTVEPGPFGAGVGRGGADRR